MEQIFNTAIYWVPALVVIWIIIIYFIGRKREQ